MRVRRRGGEKNRNIRWKQKLEEAEGENVG